MGPSKKVKGPSKKVCYKDDQVKRYATKIAKSSNFEKKKSSSFNFQVKVNETFYLQQWGKTQQEYSIPWKNFSRGSNI